MVLMQLCTFAFMLLKDIANRYQLLLSHKYDAGEINAIFLLAVKALLDYSHPTYLLKKNDQAAADIIARFEDVLQELLIDKPIQYILGKCEFYGLSFNVNSSVLIPRPETEELVDWVFKTFRNQPNLSILDIGTGSGCIAIALQKNLVNASVFAMDISKESLDLALENAKLNDVVITFLNQDILLQPVQDHQYHVIVSNPPYITVKEKQEMSEHVLAHEPAHALFVSNENPLIFYDAIADFALKHLHKGGYLFFEINQNLGSECVEMLVKKGFTSVILRKDLNGNDRMIRCAL